MQAVPLVRSSSLLPLYRFLEQGGSELRQVRERARPAFREPETLIPVGLGGLLLEDAARAGGLDDLGRRLGQETDVGGFGEWGALIARSPTLAGFLANALASYRRFNSGYRLWIVARGDEAWLHLQFCRSLREGRRHACDLALTLWLGAFRKVLGPSWRPAEIHFEGPPPPHAEALAALATRGIAFHRPALAIGFPRTLLGRRNASFAARVPVRLGGPVPASDFAGSVRQVVEWLLRLGAPDLAVAAEAAGTSERSLQRHLGESGLTFSQLVDEVRFEAACRMLTDPTCRVIDVSTELGYGDAANFTRAFRRWAGVPPQRYRRVNATPPEVGARG